MAGFLWRRPPRGVCAAARQPGRLPTACLSRHRSPPTALTAGTCPCSWRISWRASVNASLHNLQVSRWHYPFSPASNRHGRSRYRFLRHRPASRGARSRTPPSCVFSSPPKFLPYRQLEALRGVIGPVHRRCRRPLVNAGANHRLAPNTEWYDSRASSPVRCPDGSDLSAALSTRVFHLYSGASSCALRPSTRITGECCSCPLIESQT